MMKVDASIEAPASSNGWAERGSIFLGGARYGEARRLNWIALVASIVIGAGLLSALVALDVVVIARQSRAPTVVTMLSEPPPASPQPPPPPPPAHATPVDAVPPQASVMAPRPLVPTIASPVQISTAPSPVPASDVPPIPAPAAAPSAPAIENGGDLSSKMIEARPPRYPMESRRKHEEGTVILSVLLGIDGRVTEISVSRSSGSDRLDRAALNAVKRWRWSPTRRSGVPVMVRGLVEIPFELTR